MNNASSQILEAKAKDALQAVHDNQSVSNEQVLESLETLRDQLDMLLESIHVNINLHKSVDGIVG